MIYWLDNAKKLCSFLLSSWFSSISVPEYHRHLWRRERQPLYGTTDMQVILPSMSELAQEVRTRFSEKLNLFRNF